MVAVKCLKADPCVDDALIEEEQAPLPPADPRAHFIPPWETGQTSACNDFLPPARDVAATLETATVKPAPPLIEPSMLDESDYLAVKSQKSTTSFMRKSTVMKKNHGNSLQSLKSPAASRDALNSTTEKAKQKNGK
jgi:hypothetical protein